MLPQKLRQTFSISRQLKSFRYAFAGLRYVILNESNMHVHIMALFVVLVMGFYFHLSVTEWCLVVIVIGMVVIAETLNTALELLTDLTSPDYHPLAGKAKDVAAGAVVLAAITAAIVGSLIFLPKIWDLFV